MKKTKLTLFCVILCFFGFMIAAKADSELNLPLNLKIIEEEAFIGVATEHVVLGRNVEKIGRRAFADCVNLRSLYIPESVISIQDTMLDGCNYENVVIYGQSGSEAERFAIKHDLTFWNVCAKPVLNISIDRSTYDFAESVKLSVVISLEDGLTDGLAEMYPNVKISAILCNADGEKISGFAEQSGLGLQFSCSFPLADENMPAGQYMIKVYTNISGLSGQSDVFVYTAEKIISEIDISQCKIELQLNLETVKTNDRFTMTATVTNQNGEPVKGVKVGFAVLNTDGSYADFYDGSYNWLWNITGEKGMCSISHTEEEFDDSFPPGVYIVRVFIVDNVDIDATKRFTYVGE